MGGLLAWNGRCYFGCVLVVRFVGKSHAGCLVHCPENHTNKVFLVRAEIAASKGQHDEAVLLYDKSRHYAKVNQLPSEQAFASERAGRMFVAAGQSSEAVPLFHEAIKLYAQWGAEVKVTQLKEIMANEKLTFVDAP